MARRALAILGALALATLSPEGAVAGGGPPPEDHLRAFAIVPPGQEGNVTAAELAAGDFGPHYDDQLETYAALVDDDDVTAAELPAYFHPMQFGVEGTPEATYSPTAGVTVERDALGIPHISADDFEGASFALGYVTAEDRLWEMDVFRHAARGTLAEFVGRGPNDAFLKMDIETRREGYTEQEVSDMLDALDEKFPGGEGAQVQEGLEAYADGVNAYITELKTDPTVFDERPVEYEATANPFPVHPESWTPTDTAFIAILQLRVFGETAGFELENAAIYRHLTKRLGPNPGRRVFNDVLFQNDPRSPTTVPRAEAVFPSQRLGPLDPGSVAIPDNAVQLAGRVAAGQEARLEALAALGLRAPSSNALLVSAGQSATGNPLQIGAPQVGYAVPSFFMEVDVHAPGVDFRGPAVPGASALIPLGRGRDYAWSLTTGFSDAVDVRAEKLCDPDGGEPTTDSNGYVFDGQCLEMESRQETFFIGPGAPPPGPPSMQTRTFYRTGHGPVFARGTVDGDPVAFVKERFFWMEELDSIPPFLRWNTQVDDVEDFRAAAADFTMSFNVFYADAQDIGYFHVGAYPRRARGVSPNLPVWGTGEWEWRATRWPFDRQPQVVDPARGWLANWNSKPALGWASMDGLKWGPTQRVKLLDRLMGAATEGPETLTLSELVDVIRVAATQDARAVFLGPRMLRWTRDAAQRSDRLAAARRRVLRWVRAGAHRTNRDRTPDQEDFMDRSPALAIFDTWYDVLVHRVFDDELGEGFYDLAGSRLPVSDYAPTEGSSFFFDFSGYLDNLFRGRGDYSRDYCDVRGTAGAETCLRQVVAALRIALREIREDQGPDMSSWTVPEENLLFQELGAGSVDPIPWQNRGTHNHVVEILSDAGPLEGAG